jgi:dTDP-4-dehydrorhamnose reductase
MIIILGSTGFLGAHLKYALSLSGIETLTIGRNLENDFVIDIFDFKKLLDILTFHKPKLIINLVAITDVDLCEDDPGLAVETHVKLPFFLANAMNFHDFNLIHLSTDQLYNKLFSRETDIDFLNNYARTKFLGEQSLIGTKSLIIRTNFYGVDERKQGAGLVESIFKAYRAREKITGYSDVYFNAIYVNDLVNIMLSILDKELTGVLNLGTTTYVSKADFIEKIFNTFGLDSNLYNRGVLHNGVKSALRPNFMVSDVTKFIVATNITLPTFDESFERFVKRDQTVILERINREI